MRSVLVIFILLCAGLRAQTDKVFLKNGQLKQGVIVSMGKDQIFFRSSDSAAFTQRIPKKDIILIEKYDGKILTYAKSETVKDSTLPEIKRIYRHSFGVQPFGILFGRATGSYEILTRDGKVGFLIPGSLTFDPVGVIYSEKRDSSNLRLHRSGVNFIAGLDVNFYVGKGDFEGFYLGPRIRYGVDMFLLNIEGYSLQTQVGWRLGFDESRIIQDISVGFGFVRVLSSPAGNLIDPKQSYAWGSINYRVAFRW